MRRVLSIVMVVCIMMISLTACFAAKSDEELISDRIDSFMKAYNSGDMDGVLDSLSAKTRNTLSSILSIGNSLIGNLTGIGLSLSDMFGLGVGLQAGDLLTISDVTVDIQSEKKPLPMQRWVMRM